MTTDLNATFDQRHAAAHQDDDLDAKIEAYRAEALARYDALAGRIAALEASEPAPEDPEEPDPE